jgi:ribosomal-protein-alanine N-acetyltransferase
MLPQHLARVCELESVAYDFPWSRGVFADCLSAGYSCHLLWRGEQLLGYSLVAIAAGEAHLLNLCIDPAWQRHGYAGRFLRTILRIATELDAQIVYLEVRPSNHAALALYRKFGFERVGLRKKYYRALQGREDAVVLSRDITDLS